MISLPSPSSALILIQSPFRPQTSFPKSLDLRSRRENKQRRIGRCRAEFAQDAPFAAAIGACVLNSLIFPLPRRPDEPDGDGSPIDSTDTRFAVMGIVSFIPYFNWLSWVFAWLDTSSQRYLVYSIVYLAPYFRTNLSLSPEESWLPIASIVFCIVHVQLEASIRNGDIKTPELLGAFLKSLSPASRKEDEHFQGRKTVSKKQSKDDDTDSSFGLTIRNEEQDQLPSWQEEHESKLGGLRSPPREPDSSEQHPNGDGDQMEN